jgi:hypothetical protein
VTLEEWREDGGYRDAHEPAVRRVIAGQLAELCRLTGELPPPPGLEPFFQPRDAPLWPIPHNVFFDFEATAEGAEWIDEIAGAAKPLRDARAGRLVIGHGDWTVKHFRFDGLRPTVIYDWDSLNADFESVFVGSSAATFTYTEHLPVSVWPTVEEARAFLDEYEPLRAEAFTPEERAAAGAAAVYSRLLRTRPVVTGKRCERRTGQLETVRVARPTARLDGDGTLAAREGAKPLLLTVRVAIEFCAKRAHRC